MRSVLLGSAAIVLAALPAAAQDEAPGLAAASLAPDEITVTAAPYQRPVAEVLFPVTVLDSEAVARRATGGLGETLRYLPGVTSTAFGLGASRPIIRGQGGDRIRTLIDGLGSIDAASISADHAVAIEPLTAERIEVLRGPASLIYGPQASAGVINVIDGRVPLAPIEAPEALARLGYGTAAEQIDGAVRLGFGGTGFALRLTAFGRDSDDVDIPGFAESDRFRAMEAAEEHDDHHDEDHDHDHDHEEEEEIRGTLPNSDTQSYGGTLGGTLFFEGGSFGLAISGVESEYGLPGGHEHGHAHGDEDKHGEEGHDEAHGDEDHDHEHGEEEEDIRIELEQVRVDLRGTWDQPFGPFARADLRFAYADYEHVELEGPEVGTRFENTGYEGRLSLVQQERQGWRGAIGGQIRHRDFSAIGAEAFVPPTETDQYGVFAAQELSRGPWLWEGTLRLDHQNSEAPGLGIEREDTGISASLGAGVELAPGWRAGLFGFRSERAPTPEELYSNGPHAATRAFEIGDPGLDEEIALGLEATLQLDTERVQARFSAFVTDYDGYVFQRFTGAEEDGLDVLVYDQEDASFYGAEGSLEVYVGELGPVALTADGALAYVRAETDNRPDNDLPRIPPLEGLVGLSGVAGAFDGRVELDFALDQDDVAAMELPTDGFVKTNLFLGWRPFEDDRIALEIAAFNLFDEEVRLHSSYLKDEVPLAGRNIRFRLTARY